MLFGCVMIITISGTPGSGKSTVAKAIGKALKLKHFSAGDFMRALAADKGVSLAELSKEAEKSDKIDREIDARTVELFKREDNFVIDSRLAFHFAPKSLKVVKIFLICNTKEAARRIYGDVLSNKRSVESDIKTQKDAEKAIASRMKSEVKRYKKYYGVDYLDEDNYDFVLDTSNISIDGAIGKVLEFVYKKK
jgi:cytidylate kinase